MKGETQINSKWMRTTLILINHWAFTIEISREAFSLFGLLMDEIGKCLSSRSTS